MAGMLQIITYLLGVYLIFTGVEILQIALMSPREDRTAGLMIGGIMLAASVVAAIGFSVWIDNQAASLSRSMPRLPGS